MNAAKDTDHPPRRRREVKPAPAHQKLLSPAQAALELGVTERTVWRWIAAGVLPTWRPPAKAGRSGGEFRGVRIRRRDLDRVIAR